MWWHNGMGWGTWVLMTLSMVAFWSLVVFALVSIFGSDREAGQSQTPHEPDPEKILDERLARGEIDVDEYQQRQHALRAAGSGATTG